MYWTLGLDVVVAILLVATIAFAIRLNNRLLVLRADRERLLELIDGLQRATRAAEEAVRGLKVSAAESGRDLQAAIERAGTLTGDLGFLIERGSELADKLERAVRPAAEPAARPPARAPQAVPAGMAPPGPAAPPRQRREPVLDPGRTATPDAASPLSRSERELQRLLDGRRS